MKLLSPIEESSSQLASPDSRPRYEVGDVFRVYGESYRATHSLAPKQQSVMRAIEYCRSSRLGCHLDRCDSCGHTEVSYNSCRDRHCPKCQGSRRRKWVNQRLRNLLPVPYYHVVFTLPDTIFPMCLFNQKLVYNLLFDSAAQTLLTFGRDEKWMGGEIGFFGILHTWGQQLPIHPHIHFIVTGGGIDADGCWVPARHRSKFLFPVRALSKVFRGRFIDGLKQAYAKGQLEFPGSLMPYRSPHGFEEWIRTLCAHQWIVFTKAPFADPRHVIEYVGRYTHRVAISNHRLRCIDDGRITFSYKDYADNDKIKETVLSADEFIRRFLFHVLPPGFHKIRHYGFLANGRKQKLQQAMACLLSQPREDSPPHTCDLLVDNHSVSCPVCGQGRLQFVAVFPAWSVPASLTCFQLITPLPAGSLYGSSEGVISAS